MLPLSLPEVPFDLEKDVIEKILNTKKSGKKHFIVVVAEGVGHVDELAKEIEAKCGMKAVRPFSAMCSAAARRQCATA